jgi:hypothetical protein
MPNKQRARSEQQASSFLLVAWHVLHGIIASRARSEQQAASFLLVAWHVLHGIIASHPRRWSLPRERQIQYFSCFFSEKENKSYWRP